MKMKLNPTNMTIVIFLTKLISTKFPEKIKKVIKISRYLMRIKKKTTYKKMKNTKKTTKKNPYKNTN